MPWKGGEEEPLAWMLLEKANLSTWKEDDREKLQGHRVRESSFLSSLLIVCSRKESGYRLYTKQENL